MKRPSPRRRSIDRLLRRGAEALVLQRLLDGWASGADRGAAISRRLRRHHRRRSSHSWPDARRRPDLVFSGADEDSSERDSAGEACARCTRRFSPPAMRNDGAVDGVLENPQGCRFDPKVLACAAGSDGARLPDGRASRSGAEGLCRREEQRAQAPPCSQGSKWDRKARGPRIRSATLSICSSTWCSRDRNWNPNTLNFDGHDELSAANDGRLLDASNPRSEPVLQERREAAHVSRLERSGNPGPRFD